MEEKKDLLRFIENGSIFTLGLLLIIFPLAFSTLTTDAFSLPKQVVLGITVFASLLFLGARFVVEESVRIRRTPFDLPVILFTIVALLSAVFAVNQSDAIQTFVPLFTSVLLFFSITNNIKRDRSIYFISSCLLVGASILSFITVLSYLKIYVLPFPFARVQTFSPFGSLFDQTVYLLVALSLAAYFVYPLIKNKALTNRNQLLFLVLGFLTFIGFIVSLVASAKLQPTQILPFETGFQTALSAISQDTGRVIKSLFFGSGLGTFFTDFTRYKQPSFNLNQTIWTISFFRSSSFVLELLATTGVLGFITFLFLSYRVVKTKPLFIPAALVILLAFILPFSLTSLVLMFAVLGIFSSIEGNKSKERGRFFDIELHLVALKKGIFSLSEPQTRETSPHAPKVLSIGALTLIALVTVVIGFYLSTLTISDVKFQHSFVSAASNNASQAYSDEVSAISFFGQRDGYHRIFSQLNLNLANNLAASVPKGSSPSAQTQQTIYTLIQQSINSARLATTISPQTTTNWQNLSSIYRSLIGFGQNADTFAVLAAQQAAVLDPNNPQEYISLGGIFYQLGQWDNAITQFQTAVNLKPDYPNAYYNLGHALEQKGDLKGALASYTTVKTLVKDDKANLDKINSEIDALQKRISQGAAEAPAVTNEPSTLNVNEPNVQLPAQPSPVKIPAPQISPTPKPSTSPTPSASPSPTPALQQ